MWCKKHLSLSHKWFKDILKYNPKRLITLGLDKFSRGVHSLLYFAYTCIQDLFIRGVIYLAKNIIRWWYFTCKKPKNITCDGIFHVTCFTILKSPILQVHFLQNLPTMNILDPIFLSLVVLRFSPVISPNKFYIAIIHHRSGSMHLWTRMVI
jgi:hypothetical protein